MALLPQTATPCALLYNPATALVAPVSTGSAVPAPVGLTFLPGTVQIGATFTGTVGAKRWTCPTSFITPTPVWQGQASWPINMNITVGFGYLAIPPAGSKRVSGTFVDQSGVGIGRNGFLIDRASGAFLATFSSSPINGQFDGYVPTTNPVLAILLPSGGDSRNAVVMDNLVPI